MRPNDVAFSVVCSTYREMTAGLRRSHLPQQLSVNIQGAAVFYLSSVNAI